MSKDRDKQIQLISNKARKSYLKQYPSLAHLRDDIKNAAVLGVVKAIDHLNRSGKPIDDAYLMKAAKRSISDTVNELGDQLPIPRSSKKLAERNGSQIDTTLVDRLPADFDIEDRRGPSLMSQVIECCANDTERTIVKMLDAEYNQRQIAKYLQVDFRRVSEIIQTIKQRFDNDEDGSDDEPYVRVRRVYDGKCHCGAPVESRYAIDDGRCENCMAIASQRFSGRSQRVRVSA